MTKRRRWFDATLLAKLGADMYTIGGVVGSFLAIWILYGLLEKFLFSRFFDDPVKGKLTSVTAAWLIAGTSGGFGFANGGSYRWDAFLMYMPAALVFGFLGYRRGLALRAEIADHSETAEIFR
jgi:hypothetical protein